MVGSFRHWHRSRKQNPTSVTLPAGTVVFDRNHPPRRIYWLRSGRVQLSSNHAAILSHLTRGHFFGLKYLLQPRRGEQVATTLSPVRLLVFRKPEFYKRLQRDSRFAGQLLKNLALRMDHYEEAIRDLVTEPGERRLARVLARLAPSRPASGWVLLPWKPTNSDLAKMVGITRWSVSHFLSHLQELGSIRRDDGLWIHREALDGFLRSRAHQQK